MDFLTKYKQELITLPLLPSTLLSNERERRLVNLVLGPSGGRFSNTNGLLVTSLIMCAICFNEDS